MDILNCVLKELLPCSEIMFKCTVSQKRQVPDHGDLCRKVKYSIMVL